MRALFGPTLRRMRMYIVFEPRTAEHRGGEEVSFWGTEILADSAKQAASTYVEQRPGKWCRYVDLWVVDKMAQAVLGPSTYQVRCNSKGEPEFYG